MSLRIFDCRDVYMYRWMDASTHWRVDEYRDVGDTTSSTSICLLHCSRYTHAHICMLTWTSPETCVGKCAQSVQMISTNK